jgi:hypothetical protein
LLFTTLGSKRTYIYLIASEKEKSELKTVNKNINIAVVDPLP